MAIILRDYTIELTPVQELGQLGENERVFMHNGLIMTANVIWNPFAPKSLITNWISTISKSSYDFLVDSSDLQKEMKIREQFNRVADIPHSLWVLDVVIPEYVSDIVIYRYLMVAARGVELHNENWALERDVKYNEESRTIRIEFWD